jgi:hypothetical protein
VAGQEPFFLHEIPGAPYSTAHSSPARALFCLRICHCPNRIVSFGGLECARCGAGCLKMSQNVPKEKNPAASGVINDAANIARLGSSRKRTSARTSISARTKTRTAQRPAPSAAQRIFSSSCAKARCAHPERLVRKRLASTSISAPARTWCGFERMAWTPHLNPLSSKRGEKEFWSPLFGNEN